MNDNHRGNKNIDQDIASRTYRLISFHGKIFCWRIFFEKWLQIDFFPKGSAWSLTKYASHACYMVYLNVINDCCLFCLFVWFFLSHSRIFRWYGDVTNTGEGLQILTYAWPSWSLSRFFSVPRLLWHKTSVHNGNLRGPVTLTPIAERLAVDPSLHVFTTFVCCLVKPSTKTCTLWLSSYWITSFCCNNCPA